MAVDLSKGRILGSVPLLEPHIQQTPDGPRAIARVQMIQISPECMGALVQTITYNVVTAVVQELQRRGALPVTDQDKSQAWAMYEARADDSERACPQCGERGTLQLDEAKESGDWVCDMGHSWLSKASIEMVNEQAEP